jgi:uncharacterized heparinase superfamily protein
MSADRGIMRSFREVYFASPLHAWRLGRNPPRGLFFKPTDIWPGDAEAGRMLLDGICPIGGRDVHVGSDPWSETAEDALVERYLHGFIWLRDLRELGGEAARLRARELVESWMARHAHWSPGPWAHGVTGERVAAWTGMFDFFGESAGEAFLDDFFRSLSGQIRHLWADLQACSGSADRIRAVRGLLIGTAALDGKGRTFQQMLTVLDREITAAILPDGGHLSRAPSVQMSVLRDLIDVRNLVRALEEVPSDILAETVERMTDILRLLRHGDGGLALFNGAIEARGAMIETLLAQSDGRHKTPTTAPDTGFQRLVAGRACVILDAGPPSPVEAMAHAAPLSFEFSVGKQRLVVNCGGCEHDARWSSALRASAAHSTLVIDDRNAVRVGPDGQVDGPPPQVEVERNESEGHQWLQGEHDGYVSIHGLLHRRRIYLAKGGEDLRGEDALSYTGAPGEQGREAVLRFHLHPRVQATIIQKGSSALLRLPSGAGWRMSCDRALSLQDSVYFGEGGVRQRCQQLVISQSLDGVREQGEMTIKWALRREDARRGGSS